MPTKQSADLTSHIQATSADLGWIPRQSSDFAVDTILDATERLIARRGVAAVAMVDVAEEAGCSRQTLYRYFNSRRSLHTAYVQREVEKMMPDILSAAASHTDLGDSLAAATVCATELVRQSTVMPWFNPENIALAVELCNASPAIRALSVAMVPADRDLGSGADDIVQQKIEWAIRAIISLVAAPHGTLEQEKQFIRKFLVPALLADDAHSPGAMT